MRLEYFHVKGFRRIRDAKIYCGDATFLIGENNIGKSSVLKALETFFTESSRVSVQDFFKIENPLYEGQEIYLEGKFVDLPDEAYNWRGFKGRIFKEIINETQTNCIYYRKMFTRDGSSRREMKSFQKTLRPEYITCKCINDFIEAGAPIAAFSEIFGDLDKAKSLIKGEKEKLELISEIWDVDELQNDWAPNPGGIEGNISIRLPKFLLIPAENKKEEIEATGGTLQKTMKELFEEIREGSENYKQAQHYLDLLAQELDPTDSEKEFGKMLMEINNIIRGIFTETKIHITTCLSDPESSIKPSFQIEMSSNVKTSPERQGMGSIRSTVFALLRYREQFVQRKIAQGIDVRPLIIGFEEPEMYLHPNAAALMRDKIYELATSTHSKIICTTHSPYMIDLSKRIDEDVYPKQVLNLLKLEFHEDFAAHCCTVVPFNTTNAYKQLEANDRNYIKFLLKIDDYIAKVFFCKRVIIVEGDTEELLFKETVDRLPEEKRKIFLSDYQIIKARGKATIISLVKYLKALSIDPFVIHDQDTEEGAIIFNEPILVALDNQIDKRCMIQYTIEDILGYDEPKSDKPFKAYRFISNNWGENWNEIGIQWKEIFEQQIAPDLFPIAINDQVIKN